MSQSTFITIQIDKDVPLPRDRHSNGGDFNVAVGTALAKMEVGNSFVYPDESETRSKASVVRYVAKKLDLKVAIRKVSDTDYRVWRVE